MKKKTIGVACSLIAGFAQGAATDRAAGSDPTPVLEEIIVTATKRDSSLQNTPVRIDVLDSEYLVRSNIREFSQVADALPNLMAPDGVTGTQNVSIRGISSPGRGFGIEQPVGVYVDGVFAPPGSLDQYFLDLAQVEIIRGPQGVVWGRNSLAGAISYVTERPTETFSGFIRGQAGNKSLRDIQFALSGPLVGDILSGRLAAGHVKREGFSRRRSGGTFGDKDQNSVRGSLRLEPGGGSRVDFIADYAENNFRSSVMEYFSGPFADIAGTDGYQRVQDTDLYEPSRIRSQGATVIGMLPLGELMLDSVTGYREIDRKQALDSDGSAQFFVNEFVSSNAMQLSQELRLTNSSDNALRWMTGVYLYVRDDDIEFRSDIAGEPFGLPTGTLVNENSDIEQETRSASVFATLDYDLNPQLTINAGLRIEHEDKEQSSDRSTVAALPVGTTLPLGAPDSADQTRTDSQTSPLLGITWQTSRDILVYASWGRGHKSGGFNSPRASLDEFDAEMADSFEVGFKSSWLEERLTLNATAFYINYEDMQVRGLEVTPTGAVQLFRNAGSMTSQGLEIQGSARIANAWQIRASLGYNVAEFDDFVITGPVADTNLAGNVAPFAPEFSASVFSRWDFSVAWGMNAYLQGEWNYTGKHFLDFNNVSGAGEQEAYDIVNLRFALFMREDVEFAFWGRNVFGEDYKVDFIGDLPPAIFGNSQSHLLAPDRTYGLELSKSF